LHEAPPRRRGARKGRPPRRRDAASYADLRQGALRVASSLHEAGLRRGDLVALVIGDAELFLTTLLGASLAGVIPASLYPPATTTGLSRYFDLTAGILRASGARAVVTTATLAPTFTDLRASCPDLELVIRWRRIPVAQASSPAPQPFIR
jgi:acyl-CoA synthetase (AMP-forming)/AMP-acid ligase II